MSGSSKVYVINPAKTKVRVDGKKLSGYLQSSADGEQSRSSASEKQSGVPLILSYLTGPLSILATRRGRKSRFWVGLSVFSLVLSVVVISMWRGLSYWSMSENPVGAIMILVAVAAIISGFSAWSRAVVLAGRYEGPRLRRSPGWIRSPLAAGLFGILCPGMGLFVAGRSKRAALALWIACLTVISLFVLTRAAWLWDFNMYAGAFTIRPDTLEYVFIFAGAAVVLGGLAWIVQALNGARLAGRVNGRKAVSRKNWAAVALLISMVAFAGLSRPAVLAEALDSGAAAASSEGLRIIPLHLSRAAVRLDPSKPDYVIRTIGLYENIGEQARADAMRRELIARLESSIAMLEEEGMVIPAVQIPEGTVVPASPDTEPVTNPVTEPAAMVIPAEMMIIGWKIGRTIP